MPLLLRALPAAKLITSLPIEALRCLHRSSRCLPSALLRRPRLRLAPAQPNSAKPSHSSALRLSAFSHRSVSVLCRDRSHRRRPDQVCAVSVLYRDSAVQCAIITNHNNALPRLHLADPIIAQPRRRFALLSFAPANPFTSRPPQHIADPHVASAPFNPLLWQRHPYQRHTLPRLTSPAPCSTVASRRVSLLSLRHANRLTSMRFNAAAQRPVSDLPSPVPSLGLSHPCYAVAPRRRPQPCFSTPLLSTSKLCIAITSPVIAYPGYPLPRPRRCKAVPFLS